MPGYMKIRLEGNFYSPELRIQGEKIALRFDGKQTWERKLEGFEFRGILNLSLQSKGKKGSIWELIVEIEEESILTINGQLEELFLFRNWEVPIIQ
jgi:hypothetical protein